jgi:AhpD family alkylhydroperoxidase
MLTHLLKLRASQINGCAYCIDMHSKDLLGRRARRSSGSTASMRGARARTTATANGAALEWIEAVTKIADTHADDQIYESVKPHFSEKEIADLTWIAASDQRVESVVDQHADGCRGRTSRRRRRQASRATVVNRFCFQADPLICFPASPSSVSTTRW